MKIGFNILVINRCDILTGNKPVYYIRYPTQNDAKSFMVLNLVVHRHSEWKTRAKYQSK